MSSTTKKDGSKNTGIIIGFGILMVVMFFFLYLLASGLLSFTFNLGGV